MKVPFTSYNSFLLDLILMSESYLILIGVGLSWTCVAAKRGSPVELQG